MRAKLVVGLAAVVAAIWIWTTINRDAFEANAYSLCIGKAGEGAMVSDPERRRCACAAREVTAAFPVRARLPESLGSISREEMRLHGSDAPACRHIGT